MLNTSQMAAVLSRTTHSAGYAVVTLDSVIEACLLPARIFAQKAEHITFTWALQLGSGVWVNIHMTLNMSSQPFHGALNKDRALINLGGKSIKHGQEILKLLDAVWAPKQVAVIYCWGQQKGSGTKKIAQRNQRADRPTKQPS
jgi:hypothetical protein